MTYSIIGADQKEYGPAGADEIRQWIAQGRANVQTLARAEGSAEWRPLHAFPEFAGVLVAVPAVPAFPMGGPAAGTNGMAVAGFILGLLSCFCCFIGAPLSILGLIFSCMGLVQINKRFGQGGKGLAIAGIILAVLGLLLFGMFWLMGLIGSMAQDPS